MPIIMSSELIRSEMKTALFRFPGLDVFPSLLNVALTTQRRHCNTRAHQCHSALVNAGLSSGRRATAVLRILQARATGPAGHPQLPTF